jgi:hypothetical protein
MASPNLDTQQSQTDEVVMVALQKRKNEYVFDRMIINGSKNGAVFMRRLGQKYQNDVRSHMMSTVYRWGLCLDLVIDDQPLSSVCKWLVQCLLMSLTAY